MDTKKIILIVGDDKYPSGDVTEMDEDYPFDVAAFIPKSLDEEKDAFRRIISLIIGKKDAENKIKKWRKKKEKEDFTSKEVVEELKSMEIYLVNQKTEIENIDSFLKDKTAENKVDVILFGYEASKREKHFKKIDDNINIVKYPHPSERSADLTYWGDIDYRPRKEQKYNTREELEAVFK